MKASIHPKVYENATVVCACGNTFTTTSVLEHIKVELCSNCHPFYTGDQRFVDTASMIQKFEQKKKTADAYKAKRVEKEKEQKTRDNQPKSLREMLMAVK